MVYMFASTGDLFSFILYLYIYGYQDRRPNTVFKDAHIPRRSLASMMMMLMVIMIAVTKCIVVLALFKLAHAMPCCYGCLLKLSHPTVRAQHLEM